MQAHPQPHLPVSPPVPTALLDLIKNFPESLHQPLPVILLTVFSLIYLTHIITFSLPFSPSLFSLSVSLLVTGFSVILKVSQGQHHISCDLIMELVMVLGGKWA